MLPETHPWAEDHSDFTLALYRQLFQKPGNLFFSPFSIRTALGVAYAGARGETAVQMREALRFPPDGTPHIAFAEIINRLSQVSGRKCEMAMANSLWSQEGVQVQTGFLDLVARYYDGGMNVVDFRHGAEVARLTINRWVEDKTKQKIRELIPAGGLNADTRLVMTNAVYFKGIWVVKFRKTATRDEPFYLEGRHKVMTPLMHQQKEIGYIQDRGFQAVDLNYQDGDLSMLILLPNKRNGLKDLEVGLSERILHDCVTKMIVRQVKLFLPRFRLTCESEMGSHLRELGMPLAFTRFEADFSGINGLEPQHEDSLFISDIFHKAFVEVNEKGTEAAAATSGVMMRGLGAPSKQQRIPIFRADHPFLFAIYDRKCGAILFLGRMADPTRES